MTGGNLDDLLSNANSSGTHPASHSGVIRVFDITVWLVNVRMSAKSKTGTSASRGCYALLYVRRHCAAASSSAAAASAAASSSSSSSSAAASAALPNRIAQPLSLSSTDAFGLHELPRDLFDLIGASNARFVIECAEYPVRTCFMVRNSFPSLSFPLKIPGSVYNPAACAQGKLKPLVAYIEKRKQAIQTLKEAGHLRGVSTALDQPLASVPLAYSFRNGLSIMHLFF